ncbi:nucleotide-binding protein [Mesorhizobium sp. M1328]|uniref:nucleotide-binding protein n=1 Tax=Mesorhizobium sp. M1328 TaxID=2957082 RepID=UPI00333DC4C1
MNKPFIFIGSSSENLRPAKAIAAGLSYDAETIVWTESAFGHSEYPLEALERHLDRADFAVFVFIPDDVTVMRGETRKTVRDNVLFELGLFIGRLTRKRTFIVRPRGIEINFPSDLIGITPVDYEPSRTDDNLAAALGPATHSILEAIRVGGRRPAPENAGRVEAEKAPEKVPADADADKLLRTFEPADDWQLWQYEDAFMLAVFHEDETQQSEIDSAFRACKLADSEEALAVWDSRRAYLNMRVGKSGALETIQAKVATFPNNSRLYDMLGDVLAYYGDTIGAVSAHAKALDCAASIEQASAAVSSLVTLDGVSEELDYAGIKSKLLALSREEPTKNALLRRTLRSLASANSLKQIANAIDEVRLKETPDDTSLRFDLAHSYGHSDTELALMHYESIPVRERTGMAWNNLGVAYSTLKITGEAVAAYEEASSKGETLADANLAFGLIQGGFFGEARKRLQAAVAMPDHHTNVVDALSSLDSASREQEDKVTQARAIAKTRQVFLLELGCAALQSDDSDIVGKWETADGVLNVCKRSDGSYEATEEFEREATGNALTGNTLAGLFSTYPRQRTEIIELRIRQFGNAFEGTLTRRPKDQATVSLIDSFARETSIVAFLEGTAILKVQLQSFEKTEVVWRKLVEPPLLTAPTVDQ